MSEGWIVLRGARGNNLKNVDVTRGMGGSPMCVTTDSVVFPGVANV